MFPFATFSPTFVTCCLFDNSHSDRCERISHCVFDLHLFEEYWCWTSFHVPIGHLYSSFEKMSVRSFAHFLIRLFVFLMSSGKCSLYILDINPLSDILFVNIFSHSVGGLFVLLIVSFAVKNLFCLMHFHLFILIFASHPKKFY